MTLLILLDHRYPEPKGAPPSAIAFDWELARPWIIVDEKSGVDFGALFINDLAVKALEVKGKIPALLDDVVLPDPAVDFPGSAEIYLLLGYPRSRLNLTEKYAEIFLAMYIVTKKDPNADVDLAHVIPTFYGQLQEDAGKIEGVSGGPLFGLTFDTARNLPFYWLHAIQRGQLGREIRAPLISELARMLRDEVRNRAQAQ